MSTAPLCAYCGQPLVQLLPSAAPNTEVALHPEAARINHDARIWPVNRAVMADFRCVRERMTEDAGRLLRRHTDDRVITAADFTRLGWTPAQVADHGATALKLADEARQPRKEEAA